MFNHSLICLTLLSFSIASHAATASIGQDQAVQGAIQNAALHKGVVIHQVGGDDKDVTNTLRVAAPDTCLSDAPCTGYDRPAVGNNPQVSNSWFAVKDSSSALQPVAVLLLIIGIIVFFLARKSASTK